MVIFLLEYKRYVILLLLNHFQSCSTTMNQSMFPHIWKKLSICPIHKKKRLKTNNQQLQTSIIVTNLTENFERLIFMNIVGKNKLLSTPCLNT